MNTKLLLKVKAAILDEPAKFDMDSWFQKDPASSCGTSACIAGHVIAIKKKWKRLSSGINLKEWPGDIAQELLEITETQRFCLFTAENWPAKFRNAYFNARTSKGRAKAGAMFIDHFIATNGQP